MTIGCRNFHGYLTQRQKKSNMKANQNISIGMVLFLLVFLGDFANAESDDILEVGNFSGFSLDEEIPNQWQPLTFKNINEHTTYSLVEENGQIVIMAESNASASGLIREISIDPRKYQWITWRWKISNIFEKGDVTQKKGDDYPARIYITFEYSPDKLSFFEKTKYKATRLIYGQYPPHAAINYIWESKAPRETVVPNPYTDRVKMIVVENGDEYAGVWREEKRNVYEDYKKAFGEEPPMISGVAIMTDSDNTGESAVAYYGDILFMKQTP
jgi:hypothetical protein